MRKLYEERLQRVQDAIALKEPDRVPICTKLGIGPYIIAGCSNRDAMYGYTRAIEANVNYYKKNFRCLMRISTLPLQMVLEMN